MKVRTVFVVALLALGSARFAGAQAHTPDDHINTALARAREVGIPVALLESKIAEGKAKGVSMDRIAAAIERREAALEKASQALRGRPDADGSLGVGADAIESGVSEAVLKAVADNAPGDRRNVAIAALTELVRQGTVPEVALDRVREALKHGPEALANLPAQAAAGQAHRDGGSAPGNSGGNSGNSHAGGSAGSPPAVPAPGGSPQQGKPGGPPSTPGRPSSPGKSGK